MLKRFFARVVSLALILNLLVLSMPAAPRWTVVRAQETATDIRYAISSSGLSTTPKWASSVLAFFIGDVEKKADAVLRIEVHPKDADGSLSILQGQTVNFTAVAYGQEDPISGKSFEWSIEEAQREGSQRRLPNGVFKANRPGSYHVTTLTDGIRGSLSITVSRNDATGLDRILRKPDSERDDRERGAVQRLREAGRLVTREIDTTGAYDPSVEAELDRQDRQKRDAARAAQEARRTTGTEVPSSESSRSEKANATEVPSTLLENFDDRNVARKGGPRLHDDEENAPVKAGRTAAAVRRPAEDDGWGPDDWYTADDPVNAVGFPAGSSPDAGAGNGNFRFAAPVISLAGRGIDVNLSLFYNSRLWNKSGTVLKYDSDMGFPGPGWSIGFGKMIYMGGTGGCMIATANGTRRSHTGSNWTYSSGSTYLHTYTGATSDGSFIDYSCGYSSTTGGTSLSGYARLANGTTIEYSSPSANYNQVYPTKITDAQGNYILITYKNNQGPRIDTVTDTLARVISFNYDTEGRLFRIRGPGYNGTTRTYVNLNYKQLTLDYEFASGLTTDTATDTPWVIKSIHYPVSNLGYWFGDNDSYSSYGMIAKIISDRGMAYSAMPPNSPGTISKGTSIRTEEYNYTLEKVSTLTDSPGYDSYKDTWDKMNVAPQVETTYDVTDSGGNQTIEITRPDGSVEKQISNSSGYYFENQVLSGSNVLSKMRTYFGSGAYSSTRPTSIEMTDSIGNVNKTEFTYGSSYNQVTAQKEYNYGNVLYREARYTYENNTAYTGRHIFSLVKTAETYDASNNRLSRTEYEYDNNAVVNGTSNPGLIAASDVVHHNETSDPHTSDLQWVDGDCELWEWSYPSCTYEGEIVYGPPWPAEYYCTEYCTQYEQIQVSVYEPASLFRGNVTKVTTYANAGSTLSGAIAYDFEYDVTGNQRTATTNCCEEMSFNYTVNTQYSQPESVTKGSPDPMSPHRITTSASYDFNTGVVKTSTDANGGDPTTFTYDGIERLTLITAPTGAKTTTDYDDVNWKPTKTVQLVDNTVIGKTQTELNGRGQPVKSGYFIDATNQNQTSIEYDAMGRRKKVSMPYASSGSAAYWTEYTYDHLSRVTQVTAPDGSVSQTIFNETPRPDSATSALGQTVRSRDAWGRERWARTDAFGRLVEVVEPNPSGSATTTAMNVAASANGATATASSTHSSGNYPLAAAINGDRKGLGWGSGTGGWNDNTQNSYPDWLQVAFNGTKTINEISVFTIQDNETSPAEPTETMTFTQDGIIDFEVQYWNGTAWTAVSGGKVTGNNKVWRKFTFAAVTTDKIRVQVTWSHSAAARYSRIAEVEAWTQAVTSSATGSVFDPGSMRTEYVYDRQDQLTQITQGAQERKFKYDSLGRLTRQKLAEQTATINDLGNYVGSGGSNPLWSDAFKYDAKSNLTERLDARGVKTVFDYGSDPLNRLQGISYNTSGAPTTPTIHPAPDVSIQYMTTGDVSRVWKVITDGIATEENTYDTEGRVKDYSLEFADRTSHDMITSYQYDDANRPTEIRYPTQWGVYGDPREEVVPSYDDASRLSGLVSDNSTISGISYNAMGQVTQLNVSDGTDTISENYGYDAQTGLLTSQYVHQTTGTPRDILHLGYGYSRGNSVGSESGKTGQLTQVVNLLDQNKDRTYEHDALGRLVKAKGGLAAGATGITANWTQEYSYDRYGNKTGTTKTGVDKYNSAAPLDGLPSVTYQTSSNRMDAAAGWEYDLTGNLTRGQNENGVWQRFEYDAAGRLVKIKDDSNNELETYVYGVSRNRLKKITATQRTYYAWGGNSPLMEYTEAISSSTPAFSKSYVYAGSRLVSTTDSSGTRMHHPDRLGTGAISAPSLNQYTEHSTLPFGTEIAGETSSATNQTFTSYDRSASSGLDYAVNRTYSQGQSRFTQVDPIGMMAASIGNPQSNNLYGYTQNMPVDFVDPSGLVCTLNINIVNNAGVSNKVLSNVRKEMRRIYAGAGVSLVFNSPNHPGINITSSFNLTIQDAGTSVGATRASPGETEIYNDGYASTDRLEESIRGGKNGAMGMHAVNFGRALGRVGAHESAHFFLQANNAYHASSSTLMQRDFNGEEWWADSDRERNTNRFTPSEAAKLRARCPRDPVTNPPTSIHTTFGGGGGTAPGGYSGGYGGMPSWWHHMQDFLRWVNSIPVGPSGEEGDGDGTQLG